jgi:acetyl-CoA synthetase
MYLRFRSNSPKMSSEMILPPATTHKSHLSSLDEYKEMHKESLANPNKFFGKLAIDLLTWITPPTLVSNGGFANGDTTWFTGGTINVSYNCVDRHAIATPDKVAIIYEADEPGNAKKITYKQLLASVCSFANVLKSYNVRKGDVVAIYLPMVPGLPK